MDDAGTGWTVAGAQATVSSLLNGDWSRHWTFHRSQEHLGLYGTLARLADDTTPVKYARPFEL